MNRTRPSVAQQVTQEFARCGSEVTPVHPVQDFVWEDFAPMVFRRWDWLCLQSACRTQSEREAERVRQTDHLQRELRDRGGAGAG